MSASQVLLLVAVTALLAWGWWYRRDTVVPWFSLSGRLRWSVLRAQRRSLRGDRQAGFAHVADLFRVEVPDRMYHDHVEQVASLQAFLAEELGKGAHRLGASITSDIRVLVVCSQDPTLRWPTVHAYRAARLEATRVELCAYGGNAPLSIPAPTALIGRDPRSATVLVVDDTVSREHASISTIDGAISITDHYTLNGTYRNGVRIPSETAMPLEDGDSLVLGEVTFQVRVDRGMPTTAALGAPAASVSNAPQHEGGTDTDGDRAARVRPGRAHDGTATGGVAHRLPTEQLSREHATTEKFRHRS